ncbi:carbohydrate ABC transporter substrate-binding protein, CUT1 family [Selenomonas ruminantium]|uniref:Carbohydrate ABC transporter substrate-binding protein, CUT1 family n=1 Tax=Selenomonas ruminantium TaxID=971 RepID=A0A1M6WDI2_SELRU|nr:extracellular solute-binding protein [Selenomonas ruminantium]SHK91636.1 carbohydrate ABC transporter substrate-binding protein, CUT1 family [Selenomonas ruminantium]
MKRGFALYLAFLVFMTCFLGWYLTRPKVLTVGLFAGSNWNVPEGDSYALLEEGIKRFEAEHPGVRVKYVSGIRKDDYSEWLAERLLKGEEPDIFVVPSQDFDLYASIGALLPLDRVMNKDADFDPSVYYPKALEDGRCKGISYALPVGSVTTLMFVNKTLLAKEGIPIPDNTWTWQDFLRICKAVTKDTNGDGRLDQFGVYDYTWRKAALTNDARIFSEDGKSADFSSQNMEEVMRFMAELHAVSQGQEVTAKDFDMGKVAFRPFTFAEYRTYKPYPWRIKKYSSFEWDCIKLPAGPSGSNSSIMQTMLVGISARSGEQRLAWELLKTLCYDPVIQEMVLTKSQALPVRRDVVESDRAQELLMETTPGSEKMDLKTVSEVMVDCMTEPKFPRYKEAMNLADNRLYHVLQENSSLSNALSQVQKEINMYLQR